MTAIESTQSQSLGRLAEIAIRIGVNLQPDQELIVNAPVEAVPFIRAIATHAYQAGARDVIVNYSDQLLARIQLENGREDIFDHAPLWRYEGLKRALADGAAVMSIAGADPNLLAGASQSRIARTQKAHAIAARDMRALMGEFHVNWSIIPFAHPAWATTVFPDKTPDEAVAALWDAIFAATRTASEGAVENWKTHAQNLHVRTQKLNAKRFDSLHFRGPGTDLTVGLIQNHQWAGGAVSTTKGIRCLPNIPTEEVFCMPHRDRVNGTVSATKPLSHGGTLIENIAVKFEAGRITASNATTGAETFANLVATDEGASHLGEVALVPHASPISESNILFYNTLFDENAASHIAIGRALGINAPNGKLADAQGANDSLIHVDWMIGSEKIDVDGIHANGEREPLMRQGEFV